MRDCVVIGEMVKNVMLLNLGLMKIRLVSAPNEINKLRDPETTHETSSGHGSG